MQSNIDPSPMLQTQMVQTPQNYESLMSQVGPMTPTSESTYDPQMQLVRSLFSTPTQSKRQSQIQNYSSQKKRLSTIQQIAYYNNNRPKQLELIRQQNSLESRKMLCENKRKKVESYINGKHHSFMSNSEVEIIRCLLKKG